MGNDPETINSVFVEVDKDTTGTKRNLIIGCIYRPPWVDLSEYNSCMTNTLALLQSEKKYIFLLGDYNVYIDITPPISPLPLSQPADMLSPILSQPRCSEERSKTDNLNHNTSPKSDALNLVAGTASLRNDFAV